MKESLDKTGSPITLLATLGVSIAATLALLDIAAHNDALFGSLTDHRTSHLLRLVEKDPIEMFAHHAIASPVIEEGLFRYLPSLLATALSGNAKSASLKIGLLSSAAFSLAHDFDPYAMKMHWGDIGVENIGKFAMGGVYWGIARKQGVAHSTAAHAAMNGTVFAAAAHWY